MIPTEKKLKKKKKKAKHALIKISGLDGVRIECTLYCILEIV